MKVVILAAGLGSRLWPLSTPEKPKQFQPLIYGESLLQYTYRHLYKIVSKEDLYIQILSGLEAHVYEQIPGIDKEHVISVPEHRDTLAETLWAVNILSRSGGQPILFKSVDQYMVDADNFLKSLSLSIEKYDYAKALITLLSTEYNEYTSNSGYFTADDAGTITAFIEKPTKSAVDELLKKGAVYRSLFIYIASHPALLNALDGLDLPWAKLSRQLLQAKPSELKKRFLDMPTIDISSTVFESSSNLKLDVLGRSHNFLDVGRYSALYELNDKDSLGNVVIGKVILGKDCRSNFIVNQTARTLVVTSTNNSVVIQSTSGGFVSSMEEAGYIGEIYKNQLYKT